MTIGLYTMAIYGVMAVGIAAVSAYLHVNGKDGSGWAIVAFFLVLASCVAPVKP